MSFDWTAQPLSIHSITNQYNLPVAIRSAPGFRGSNRPIILYSISRITFAFGRALKSSGNGSYRAIDSEIVAIPVNYPGYFECLPSPTIGKRIGVVPEKSIRPIVERMQVDHRPQAFYLASPLRVYTIESNAEGGTTRAWHEIDAHQTILFDKLVQVEYTPTINDQLTEDDYALSWWWCFGRQILPRTEYALKCIVTSQQQICYISSTSTDQINLIPVGQRGSNNVNKLQMISNLIEQFPLPINIKLTRLPGSYAYKDFPGHLQLLGSRSVEFAICASLNSSNTVVIPTNTPLKFVVSSLSSSSQIAKILSSCQLFVQSFDMQIRRILMSSTHEAPLLRRTRSRYSKNSVTIDDHSKRFKRSYSVEPQSAMKDNHSTTTTTTTDEGYRSNSSAIKKQNSSKYQRSTSVDVPDNSRPSSFQQRSSTEEDVIYNSLLHPGRTKSRSSSATSSPPPPVLPEKPPNFPYPPRSSIFITSGNLIEDIDSPFAEGAILMDASNELFLALSSDSRFT